MCNPLHVLKISQNLWENTCAGVSTYQFNSQSMHGLDKCRSSHWKCSVKKDFFKKLANSLENTCVGVSF